MPEKPEVITVAASLKPRLIGKKITNCLIYWDNIIAFPISSEFRKKIISQKIHDITTRGKFLVFSLDEDNLLIHLRMEGKFFFRHKGDPILKHEHVEFILDDQISFRFHDVRKFGKMYLISKAECDKVRPLSELGFEYNDLKLTKEYLYEKIHSKKIAIKSTLLDQRIIAGIGNIYVDEILFLSRIHPLRRSCDVSLDECDLLIQNTKIILEKAIALGGTTIKSFTSSEGVHGLFQNELLVHSKKGQCCPVCGESILTIKVGGRGTYFCSFCQK